MLTFLEIERRRRGLSRKQLAALISRTPRRIVELEKGKGDLNGTGRRQIEALFGKKWEELTRLYPAADEGIASGRDDPHVT